MSSMTRPIINFEKTIFSTFKRDKVLEYYELKRYWNTMKFILQPVSEKYYEYVRQNFVFFWLKRDVIIVNDIYQQSVHFSSHIFLSTKTFVTPTCLFSNNFS